MTSDVTTTPLAPAMPHAAAPPRRARSTRWRTVLLGLPVPLLFLAVWQLGRAGEWELPFGIRMGFLPYPRDVALSLADYAFGGIRDDAFSLGLWEDLPASALRVASGFGLATVVAVPLGVLMGRFVTVHALFDPIINLFRPVPATAWVPLVRAAHRLRRPGVDLPDHAVGVLPDRARHHQRRPPGARAAAGGRPDARHLRHGHLVAGGAAGRGPGDRQRHAGGPEAGLVILVLSETTGVPTGLGSTIFLARDVVRTDLIVVGMICIAIAGFLSDRLLMLVFRVLFRDRPLIK